MIKVVKANAEYDIDEKDLDKWLDKGYKRVTKTVPRLDDEIKEAAETLKEQPKEEEEQPKGKRR